MTPGQYLREHGTRSTPQSEPIPGSSQVSNSAGGYSWTVDSWTRLRRFLILGSDGGTYYIGQNELTRDSVGALLECMKEDGSRAVEEIVETSEAGRAPSNDPALFCLAAAAKLGDATTRRAALDALPRVARIGTHVLHFAAYLEVFGGWSRGTRTAVARWYGRDLADVAFQVTKYRQRDGWSHRDLIRLAHPKPPTDGHDQLYAWVVGRDDGRYTGAPLGDGLGIVNGFERAMRAETPRQTAQLIEEHDLPREMVNPEHLGSVEVWEALLPKMPMMAMIRNLGNMTKVGLLVPGSSASQAVLSNLGDDEAIRKARVHPIAVLSALRTYAQGHGMRGAGEWTPVPQIVDALDAAFYTAFGNVEPTGKRHLLALDVSGSMSWGDVAGVVGLTPRDAAAAMALVTAATESVYEVMGFSTQFVKLDITPRQRLDDAIAKTSNLPFAGTDCAVPMLWAMENEREVDAFVVYTDSETWAGAIHPAQALEQYRQRSGIEDAALIVVGMEGNPFTIADPNDPRMLDVVGFDTAAPGLMGDFVAGRV